MDPMTITAAVKAASAVASAAKAGGSIMEGMSRSSEMRQKAADEELRARVINTQSLQDSAARTGELQTALDTVQWLMGSRNVGFDSPSAIAIDKALEKQSREGLLVSQAGFAMEEDSARRSAGNLRKGARRAKVAGYLNAIPSLLDLASGLSGGAKSPAPEGI